MEQRLKEAIWLAVTAVFSTMCSVESSSLGGELPDLNPHCESQQEKSRRAERPTAVGVDGYHSQDTGEADGGCAELTCIPHTCSSPASYTALPTAQTPAKHLPAGAPLFKIIFSPFGKLFPISWS